MLQQTILEKKYFSNNQPFTINPEKENGNSLKNLEEKKVIRS